MYKVLLILLFLVINSVEAQTVQELADKGKFDANKASSKAHEAYLSCYALHQADKDLCVKKLNDKFLDFNLKNQATYTQNFQYQAEKLGFKKFLKDSNLECSGIDKGPIYQEAKKAYKVECNCSHEYFMAYNYKTKEWQLIE